MQKSISLSHKTRATSEYAIIRNVAFILMLGFLVYHLFPFPPFVWRLGLVLLSIVFLFKHLKSYKFVSVEKAILCFVIVNIVYFFTSFIWQTPTSTNFGNVLCSTLPLFLFYILSANGAITQHSLTVFLVFSTILGYFYFIHAEAIVLGKVISGESGDVTVNATTIFLVIIPLLFFIKNRWLTIGILAVIVYFVIFGAKRGNIVSMIIPFYLLFRANTNMKSFKSEVMAILGFAALAIFAYYVMTGSDYMMMRVEKTLEGNSSNRDIIYTAAFNTLLNGEHFYNLLLGAGTDATIHLIGCRAHNDWLEILVDFGLLGAFIYLTFFVSLVKTAWRNKKNQTAFYTLLAVFFIWFSKSLYSMGFTENLFSYLSMTIGIVLGDLSRPKHQRILST